MNSRFIIPNIPCKEKSVLDWIKLEEIPTDSSLNDLEMLQNIFIDLNENNFEKSKEWILNSIFTKSDDGIHDLIQTMFKIIPRQFSKKIYFARMIEKLYELREVNTLLEQIPNYICKIYKNRKMVESKILFCELVKLGFLKESDIIFKEIEPIKQNFFNQAKTGLVVMPRRGSIKIPVIPDIPLKCKQEVEKISINEFSLKECVNHSEVAKAIRDDDLKALQDIVIDYPNYDFNSNINQSPYEVIELIKSPTLIEYAAYYGAINCFKYLLLNVKKIPTGIARYAVAGGNIEIIRILMQNNIDFSDNICHHYAAKYFHNEILDWLLENYEINQIDCLIDTENVRIIRYLADKGREVMFSKEIMTNNMIIFKYLISINQCYSYEIPSEVFDSACSIGDLQKVKLLVNDSNAIINDFKSHKDDNRVRYTPFLSSVSNNHIDVVKYLSNTPGIAYDFYPSSSSSRIIRDVIKFNKFEMLDILCQTRGFALPHNLLDIIIENKAVNMFKILIKHNESRNTSNKLSGIESAIINNCFEIFEILINIDFKYNHSNIDKLIEASIENRRFDFFKYIFIKFDIIHDKSDEYFYESVKLRQLSFVSFIYDNAKISNQILEKSLTVACHNDDFVIAKFILDNNDVDILSGNPSAYELAINSENEDLFNLFVKIGSIETEVKRMISICCSTGNINYIKEHETELVDIINDRFDGITLLCKACLKNHSNIVEYFLTFPNIEVNKQSHYHPLVYALAAQNIDMVLLLLDHPNINVNCNFINEGNFNVSFIIEMFHYYDEGIINKIIQNPTFDPNIIISEQMKNGDKCRNIIHHLILTKKNRILEQLIKLPNLDVNALDYLNRTPLVIAIVTENNFALEMLLEHPNIDVNAFSFEPNNSSTAIFYAIKHNNFEAVKKLVSRKDIDLNIIDLYKMTIFDYLESCENRNILEIFQSE